MPSDTERHDLSEPELQEMRRQVIDWIAREEAVVTQRKRQALTAKEKPRPGKRPPKPNAPPRPAAPPAASMPAASARVGSPATPPVAPPPGRPSWPRPAAPPAKPPSARRPRDGRVMLARVSIALVFAFGLGVVVGPAIAMYGFGATNRWVRVASRIVPFPAAYVNAKLVRYVDFIDDLQALRHYQQATVTVATDPANREQVIRKLIADAMVEQLARDRGLRLSGEHLRQYLDGLANEVGGRAALVQRLERDYGMGIDRFALRVVAPHLLREQLVALAVARPEVREAAAASAQELREQLVAGALSFAEAAERYSQDVVARVGGDLGYLSLEELDAVLGPEAAKVVRALSLDTISQALDTVDGFSIYRVTERLTDDAGGSVRLRVSRLLLKPQVSTEALVHDALSRARVVRFVR